MMHAIWGSSTLGGGDSVTKADMLLFRTNLWLHLTCWIGSVLLFPHWNAMYAS